MLPQPLQFVVTGVFCGLLYTPGFRPGGCRPQTPAVDWGLPPPDPPADSRGAPATSCSWMPPAAPDGPRPAAEEPPLEPQPAAPATPPPAAPPPASKPVAAPDLRPGLLIRLYQRTKRSCVCARDAPCQRPRSPMESCRVRRCSARPLPDICQRSGRQRRACVQVSPVRKWRGRTGDVRAKVESARLRG